MTQSFWGVTARARRDPTPPPCFNKTSCTHLLPISAHTHHALIIFYRNGAYSNEISPSTGHERKGYPKLGDPTGTQLLQAYSAVQLEPSLPESRSQSRASISGSSAQVYATEAPACGKNDPEWGSARCYRGP